MPPLSEDFVFKQILLMPNIKAFGLDGRSVEILKVIAIYSYITNIIIQPKYPNFILYNVAKVTSLSDSGNKEMFYKYLQHPRLLNDSQFGFHRN